MAREALVAPDGPDGPAAPAAPAASGALVPRTWERPVIAVAALTGLMLVGGLALAVSGWRLSPPRQPRPPGRIGKWLQRSEAPPPWRVATVVGAGLTVLLLTRWPVAAVATSLAAMFATSRALRTHSEAAEMAEALTVWAEMLRDATGTPRGIEGVLVATAPGAPVLIRGHAMRLARRLPYESLDDALDGLAEDLDHPIGDLIVTALRLSARSGGRQIRAVLDDLATTAREEARMHRRVEVARARPRADMLAVLSIMGLFVLIFVVAARNYLEPYGTALGQLVLAVVVGLWAMGVWAMARLGRRHPVERFLAQPLNLTARSSRSRADDGGGGTGPGGTGAGAVTPAPEVPR